MSGKTSSNRRECKVLRANVYLDMDICIYVLHYQQWNPFAAGSLPLPPLLGERSDTRRLGTLLAFLLLSLHTFTYQYKFTDVVLTFVFVFPPLF